MNDKIRILIADDHDLMRVGIRTLIQLQEDMEMVGEAANGLQAVQMALELVPDVILMDLLMPEKDGIEAIDDIRRHNSNARIIVLTSFTEIDKVLPAIRSGALGYLAKNASPQELLLAIHEVYRGAVYLHPSIAQSYVQALSRPMENGNDVDLTDREIQILKLVARGRSNKEIAQELVISERTVGVHISHLLDKLDLENRTQAALYALRHGLVGLFGK